jgi:DNA-binding Xre family transcriptional regulator
VSGSEAHYRWRLRALMAERGMFSTTEIRPLLAKRGIALSPAQVYRLVTGTPERLNLDVLAALCDILGCTPNDLIDVRPQEAAAPVRRRAQPGKPAPDIKPTPARVTRKKRP